MRPLRSFLPRGVLLLINLGVGISLHKTNLLARLCEGAQRPRQTTFVVRVCEGVFMPKRNEGIKTTAANNIRGTTSRGACDEGNLNNLALKKL